MSLLEKIELKNPILTLSLVVWCLYIGAVLGWAGVLYNRLIPGALVRRILRRSLFTPEAAQTPQELGVGGPFYRFLLRDGSTLRRIVKCAEGEPPAPDDPVPGTRRRKEKRPRRLTASLHFYIPEELHYRAEIRYAAKPTDLLTLVIGAALLLAAAVLLYNFVIPWLMSLLNAAFAA